MFKNLCPGMIGIQGLGLSQTVQLAGELGFPGVDINIREVKALADEKGVAFVRELFAEADVRPGHWLMINEWRRDEAQWKQVLAELPSLAQLARSLGCRRTSTYFGSGSNERTYRQNFAHHVKRFRPIAEILRDHDHTFGLEFMGPRTVRQKSRFEFIHTLGEAMELAAEIGTGNVGLLLDSWHLYTSGDTPEVLKTLKGRDVVNCHVNDAPAGLTMETYVDSDRRMPMETGVIDLPAFIRALDQIGYDGPVTPEPFSATLNELAARDPDQAGRVIADCMNRLWKASGVQDA